MNNNFPKIKLLQPEILEARLWTLHCIFYFFLNSRWLMYRSFPINSVHSVCGTSVSNALINARLPFMDIDFGINACGIFGKDENRSLGPKKRPPEFLVELQSIFGYEYSYSRVNNIKYCPKNGKKYQYQNHFHLFARHFYFLFKVETF